MSDFEKQFNSFEGKKEDFDAKVLTNSFLGHKREKIDESEISKIEMGVSLYRDLVINNLKEGGEDKKVVNYDKWKKVFLIDGKEYTMGEIIQARRFGINFCLPEELDNFGEGKKLRKILTQKTVEDRLYDNLNKVLATNMIEGSRKRDLFISKAYEEIAGKIGIESKQLGVRAEQIMISVIEKLSIDRDDLKIQVRGANACEDVEDKIDFVILAKHKVRGVGVNRQDFTFEEKSIGVQFTIKLNKHDDKLSQIAKAKERGVDVDDIIFVEIDKDIIKNAINRWEGGGKNIKGPFNYLPDNIQKQIIFNLLKGLITEEQEKSLSK